MSCAEMSPGKSSRAPAVEKPFPLNRKYAKERGTVQIKAQLNL
jgi:hypothetical protein